MDLSEFTGSPYLACTDFGNDPDQPGKMLSISGIQEEDKYDDGAYPVLYLHGLRKGIKLNKTNCNILINKFGNDTSSYVNQMVEVYVGRTSFAGKPTVGLMIREDVQQQQPVGATHAQQPDEFSKPAGNAFD